MRHNSCRTTSPSHCRSTQISPEDESFHTIGILRAVAIVGAHILTDAVTRSGGATFRCGPRHFHFVYGLIVTVEDPRHTFHFRNGEVIRRNRRRHSLLLSCDHFLDKFDSECFVIKDSTGFVNICHFQSLHVWVYQFEKYLPGFYCVF